MSPRLNPRYLTVLILIGPFQVSQWLDSPNPLIIIRDV